MNLRKFQVPASTSYQAKTLALQPQILEPHQKGPLYIPVYTYLFLYMPIYPYISFKGTQPELFNHFQA